MDIDQKRAIVSYLRSRAAELEDEIVDEVARSIGADLAGTVVELRKTEGIVAAIKFYRGQTGTSLMEAKAQVERIVGEAR